jgi:hypothetical protein
MVVEMVIIQYSQQLYQQVVEVVVETLIQLHHFKVANLEVSGGGAGRSPWTSNRWNRKIHLQYPLLKETNGGNGNQGVPNYGQGGGGGASVAGNNPQNATPTTGGSGGAGSYVAGSGFAGCNGTPGPVCGARYFAGGGGGSTYQGGTAGPGGVGGGGAGNFFTVCRIFSRNFRSIWWN